jgi:hypothetical protein
VSKPEKFTKFEHDKITKEIDVAYKAKDWETFERLKQKLVNNVQTPSAEGYEPTAEQASFLDNGDYKSYWKSVYEQSNGVIGRTEMIGWGMESYVENVTEIERIAAGFTWARMELVLTLMGDDAPTMDQLGVEFAQAHYDARESDQQNVPHLLSQSQIAEYHYKVLDKYNIGRKNFGGTMLSGTLEDVQMYGNLWAPNADVDDKYASGLFTSWITGQGRSEVYFGNESAVSIEFSKSQMAKEFEYWFYKKYKGDVPQDGFAFNYDGQFGARRFLQDLVSDDLTPNAASHKIGSFQNGYVVEGGKVHFRITNTMGRKSFLGGTWLKRIGFDGASDVLTENGNRTAMSNMDMTIQWSTDIQEIHSSPWYAPQKTWDYLNSINNTDTIHRGEPNYLWKFLNGQ